MNREEAITRLRSAEAGIRARGVAHLFLFGSVVRNGADEDSDIDVFIDRDRNVPLGLMGLVGLTHMLEDVLGARVDLGTRGGLHPLIRSEVERQAIKVF